MSEPIDLSTLDASGLADRLGALRRFVCRSFDSFAPAQLALRVPPLRDLSEASPRLRIPTRHPHLLRGFGLLGHRYHVASND
ncbi:MAG: hypothetical protein WAL87_02765 [Chthoniobacterales bacterium]